MALSESQRTKVERSIAQHESFRLAYFWTPPGNASGRRSMERKHGWAVGFTYCGARYEYVSSVRCSTRNVYYRGGFWVDDQKKTVAAFRALLKKRKRSAGVKSSTAKATGQEEDTHD